MKNDKFKVKEIKAYFGDKPIPSDKLYKFYANFEPDLKATTFRWRVFSLKNQGIINNVMKGVYTISNKQEFEPVIDKKLISLFKKTKKKFPYTEMAIWETKWLNNYMLHQTFSSIIILEVEKTAAPAVFAYLVESHEGVYLNPGKSDVEKYILSGQGKYIVKNLNLTSPLMEREGLKIPTIEKIMVDLFTDRELFITYQGAELKNIFQEFFKTFHINQSTLRQYADKRHVKEKLVSFIKEGTDIDDDEVLI